MIRRVFRITFKLGLIAAVGVGIAVVVKKLTAPPEVPASLEPWPPLSTETPAGASSEQSLSTSEVGAEATNGEAASDAPSEAEVSAVGEAAPSNN
ncbi:hypothetical protein [Rhabdothermincola sp.]|uniref:hypothetical protein n=1 Tax=Rhabdothermincola sp. TaxID=2820405 RepID=UPI002FDFE0FE